jgi:hypothetical protein
MVHGLRIAGVAAACVLIAACGDDECKVGSSRCITDTLIRTCVPGNDDGPYWTVTSCSQDEVCDEDALAAGEAGSTSDAGDDGDQNAACVGTCEQGASECLSAELARYCVDGRAWQLDPCNVGESCLNGVCQIGADGGVRACVPGTRTCASDDVEKTCDADGTGWVERPCEDAEACLVDRCAPDPDASCDEESRCLDNDTALRCLGEASGFELVSCEGDTYCEFGRCRGPVCALGSVCAGLNQVRECIDGLSFRDAQCGVNEVCKQDGDAAECVPQNCDAGATVCGDPRDATVDPLRFYSQCLPGIETASGVPEWAVGECTGLLTCDPAFALSDNPCRQTCTPGAQTCRVDPEGIADGFAECQDDGTWGPIQRCNPAAESRLQCVQRPTPDASALPEALCAEPVCAYVIANQAGVGGSCDGAQLRACAEDGTLAGAQDCAVGICRATSFVLLADGRLPGACDMELECQDGEQRCIFDGLTPTPLYQVCADSAWSAALETCDSDEPCLEYVDGDGLSRSLCGAECAPGHRRCGADGSLETCDANGAWATGDSCSAGSCVAIGNNDAACVLECAPGGLRCAGGVTTAPDGAFGYTMQATCDADGVLEAAAACDAGELCRISGAGEHVGCVQCIGADVLGGNALGFLDSRCDPADAARVQSCAADNTWAASRACTSGTSCTGPFSDSCGSCTSAAGNTVICTQTNIDDLQVCGSCTVSATLLAECTETAISALTTGAESCNSQFGGATTAWGGEPDCCDGSAGAYLQTTNATCGILGYGFPGAWAGELDCCSTFMQAAGGPSFAYCAP